MSGVIKKEGRQIKTLEQWLRYAPPKSGAHWKDGRSAKESAKSWLAAAPSIPAEIAETLYSQRDIGPICDWCAEPEARVRIDEFRGEHPNLDILLVGQDENGPIVIAVEAKADETFGSRVRETLPKACSTLANKPQSKCVKRIERLLAALFGATTKRTDILALRYQLLTVTAAAMAEAERRSAQRAVVMIHEFVTPLTDDNKHAANACDLDQFVAKISCQHAPLKAGTLQGPFKVQGKPIVEANISLYFGKAVLNKR